jgi:hypothetical protein
MIATLGTVLLVVSIVALRMLYTNPAWLILPKSWQRWLFDKSYSPLLKLNGDQPRTLKPR